MAENRLVENRLTEIIQLASKLKWITPIDKKSEFCPSYPLMQLSEVEKCMLAMIDDSQLQTMRIWAGEFFKTGSTDCALDIPNCQAVHCKYCQHHLLVEGGLCIWCKRSNNGYL